LPKYKNERKEKMKYKSMKNAVASLFVFAAILLLGHLSSYSQKTAGGSDHLASASPLADNEGRGSRAIEGTWDVVVTIRNCETGAPVATFKAMDMFIQGGSVVDTNAAPPSTRGPGFGSWEFVGDHEFRSTVRFYMYNPDGSFAGVRRLAQTYSVSVDNNSWESTVGITVFNPAGTMIATACGTAIASRAE
jgi:hypothetical protein